MAILADRTAASSRTRPELSRFVRWRRTASGRRAVLPQSPAATPRQVRSLAW